MPIKKKNKEDIRKEINFIYFFNILYVIVNVQTIKIEKKKKKRKLKKKKQKHIKDGKSSFNYYKDQL